MTIGTILKKPVSPAEFRTAMAFCCNPANNAWMLEYKDRYEIAERLAEEPTPEPETWEEPVTLEERLAATEDAIAELATLITEGA